MAPLRDSGGGGGGVVHECYFRCQSRKHGSNLSTAVAKSSLSDEQVAAYLKWCCVQYAKALDAEGRSLLHVAAAKGRQNLLKFLLNHPGVKIDVQDEESGYTALHRSLFYGQIHCAVTLLQAGASTEVKDWDGLTPFGLLKKDRTHDFTHVSNPPTEVRVWGANACYNLGVGHNNAISKPKALDYFRKNNIPIKEVHMNKFHSIFVGYNGKVWACGSGGARLGLGQEGTILVPKIIKIDKYPQYACKSASVAVNHSLLLMENGSVWSFGLNNHLQLGLDSREKEVSVPTRIDSLKTEKIVGVKAMANYSIFWSKHDIFTCGENAGQMGHSESAGKTIAKPKAVRMVGAIKDLAASPSAIVVLDIRDQVILLRNYKICTHSIWLDTAASCRRVFIMEGCEIEKSYSIGRDEFCVNCHPNEPHEAKAKDDQRVVLLCEDNELYLTGSTMHFHPLNVPDHVTDLAVAGSSVMLATNAGDVYEGRIKRLRPRCTCSLFNFDSAPAYRIAFKRIPHIHRAVTFAVDVENGNFAAVQLPPPQAFVRKARPAHMVHQMRGLLETATESDDLHDVVFDVQGTRFPAHRYVVSHSSAVLEKLVGEAQVGLDGGARTVQIDNVSPQIFEKVLSYLYTGECHLRDVGLCPRRYVSSRADEEKTRSLVNDLNEAAEAFGLVELSKALTSIKNRKSLINVSKDLNLVPVKFDRTRLTCFSDIRFRTEDGDILPAHKCILTARSDYFSCMLNNGWRESYQDTPINFPVPSVVLQALFDYLYTDEVTITEDMKLNQQIHVLSDQLLCDGLKDIVEESFLNNINLKNATDLLQMSITYNSTNLRDLSMKFICMNLPEILEGRYLEVLDGATLQDLSHFYRSWLPSMARRDISPAFPDAGPDPDLISKICATEPVSLENVQKEIKVGASAKSPKDAKVPRKKRNSETERPRRTSTSSTVSEQPTSPVTPLSDVNFQETQEPTWKPEKEKWIKVTSGRASKQLQFNKAKKVETSPVKPVPADVPPSSAKAPPVVSTPSQQPNLPVSPSPSVPPPKPSQPASPPVRTDHVDVSPTNSSFNDEFPELNGFVPDRKVSPTVKSPRESGNKKFVKLSQKQRKKLAMKSLSESEESPRESTSPVKPAWVVPKTEWCSIVDIIEEEMRAAKLSGSNSTNSPPMSPPSAWGLSSVSPPCPPAPSFSRITASERRDKILFEKMVSKPLAHIQMEEKAIRDLMILYDVANVTDERIAIRTVGPMMNNPRSPVWVARGHPF